MGGGGMTGGRGGCEREGGKCEGGMGEWEWKVGNGRGKGGQLLCGEGLTQPSTKRLKALGGSGVGGGEGVGEKTAEGMQFWMRMAVGKWGAGDGLF